MASLLSPSASARRDSAVISETDLQRERDELLHSLQSSKPKQILQSLAFLTSLSTQSLTKQYSTASTPPSKRSPKEKRETDSSLLPLKQSFLSNCEKLMALEHSIANIKKKEYTTTEAKCRALRAARAEALDRLDELISSNEPQHINGEWDDDVNAAKEIIVILIYRKIDSGTTSRPD